MVQAFAGCDGDGAGPGAFGGLGIDGARLLEIATSESGICSHGAADDARDARASPLSKYPEFLAILDSRTGAAFRAARSEGRNDDVRAASGPAAQCQRHRDRRPTKRTELAHSKRGLLAGGRRPLFRDAGRITDRWAIFRPTGWTRISASGDREPGDGYSLLGKSEPWWTEGTRRRTG